MLCQIGLGDVLKFLIEKHFFLHSQWRLCDCRSGSVLRDTAHASRAQRTGGEINTEIEANRAVNTLPRCSKAGRVVAIFPKL